MSLADLATDIRDMVLAQLPWLSLLGRFRFRVTKHTSGRLDCEPVNATWIKPFPLADAWCGIPGCRVQPTIGDEVIVEFLDRVESQPVVTGFAPLSVAKPQRIEIDANVNVDLGGGTKTVHRDGDLSDGGHATAAAGPATFSFPDGTTWQLTGAVSGAVVNFTIVPGNNPANAGKFIAKANPSTSKVRA